VREHLVLLPPDFNEQTEDRCCTFSKAT